MPLTPDDLALAATRTLAHYERSADRFWEGTRDHDVAQNYTALLSNITAAPPFSLLDFGCGPGRDLRYFSSLGHEAVGLDGCESFCRMARAHSGCEVLHQDFLALSLERDRYHGIFANASLFHVPSQALPRVLGELRDSLKEDGILFCSNPRGHNEEGWSSERYGCYWDLESWTRQLVGTGFVKLAHYYRPENRPPEEQPWLATVWRKAARDQ